MSFLLLELTLVDFGYVVATIASFTFGSVNIVLGLVTRKSSGVTVPQDGTQVKLSVDKGVIGSTIYNMAFSDTKLVLKRLSSARVTLLMALLLAIIGYATAGLIGAAEGGVTAFSVQEFLTQRKRNAVVKGNVLDGSSKGDIVFQYSDIDKVEIGRNRLRLFFGDRVLRIVISRKYPTKMRQPLVKILGSKESDELVSSGKASKKEDHQRNHS